MRLVIWGPLFVANLLLLAAPLCAQNATQLENAKTGSPDWQLTIPATNHEIEGYASLTSVNRGGQISLFVSTADPTFTLEVFRMGWYGGAGARRMMPPVQLTGKLQPTPIPDPTTGIVECQWTNPYVLSIPSSSTDPTNWASGVYLVRLTGNVSFKQSWIIFTVRDDLRASTYLFQLSMNTFQAYNNWGGKSLYGWNSTNGVPAINVSFNRPYALGNQLTSSPGVGAGEFLTNLQPVTETGPAGWAYNMLRFLEREGYDVDYISDVDAHENAALLLSHRSLLIVGHCEYWSWQMRTNVQAARDAGLGIGFFSSNTCYWQIRFSPSSFTGAPDRTIVAYKELANSDPYGLNPSTAYLTTTQWRLAPVNMPEDAFVGVMYGTDRVNGDLVVTNSSHWVYSFTGLTTGAHLPGMLGYEVDYMQGDQPPSAIGVAHELPNGVPADTVVYTAAGGNTVFAAGSFQWSWGLDDYNAPSIRPSNINPAAQQITRNVLARLAGQSLLPSFSLVPSPRVQNVVVASGTTANYVISLTAFGYSPTISLSVTGLPANTAFSFTSPSLIGSGSSNLTVTPTSSSPIGTYVLTISATDGTQVRTEAVTLNLAARGVASFVGSDTTTKGNWQGVYGIDGYSVAGGAQSIPAYASFAVQNQQNYTWTTSTSDFRALQTASGRIAACWYNSSSFSFDLNITDGGTHQIALYALDWDSYGGTPRAETIQITDASSNAVLSTQSISNFTGGTYLVWSISGHVKINVSWTAGANALVSGVFFGKGISIAPAAATFTGSDTTTKGNWQGVYGIDGYSVAGGAQSIPAYASFAVQNQQNYTWTASTSDPRALQTPSGRIAACWYNNSSFSFDLNITDGGSHQIALYALDWDSYGGTPRAETIQITDASSNAVLSTQSISNFTGGTYLVWSISGHVKINVSWTAGANALVSGVFFGKGISIAPAVATFTGSDTTTKGNWQGVYGIDGYSIAGGAQSIPAYASFAVQNQQNYTWTASTSDPRALQTASGRIAACWYNNSSFSFDLNITDGGSHKIAVYALDWDSYGPRAETIQITDASSNAVLSTQSISNFTGGTYLVWNISGHVKINVSWTAGANAVVSGVFFK